jgi:Domain of unknown function (DUF4331)
MVFNRKMRRTAAIGLSALAMVALGAPGVVVAADHLDAPGFPNSPLGRHDADINDVYVFAADETHTVLAMTTHPALGVVTTQTAYATDVVYKINVSSADPSQHGDLDGDNDGDGMVSFQVRFGPTRKNGTQRYRVTRLSGDDKNLIAKGRTGEVFEDEDGDGTMAFAGARSDPFFFDLDAFNNTVQAVPNGRSFSNPGVDFFSALNTNVIAIQVPNEYLGSSKVNVWASTNSVDGSVQYDRMARPAINTVFNGFKKVFNSGANTDKNEFNLIVNPADDPTAGGGKFRTNVITVLQEFSSLSGTAYTNTEAEGLADVLLPDVLPYDTTNSATNGVFNGRSPGDDVIDTELTVVTKGAVKSDGVGPHTDYLSVFPYFGEPH